MEWCDLSALPRVRYMWTADDDAIKEITERFFYGWWTRLNCSRMNEVTSLGLVRINILQHSLHNMVLNRFKSERIYPHNRVWCMLHVASVCTPSSMHVAACRGCVLLGVVAQSLKPIKRLSQHRFQAYNIFVSFLDYILKRRNSVYYIFFKPLVKGRNIVGQQLPNIVRCYQEPIKWSLHLH